MFGQIFEYLVFTFNHFSLSFRFIIKSEKKYLLLSLSIIVDLFDFIISRFKSKTNFDLSKIAPYINDMNVKELVTLFEETHFNIQRNGNVKMLFINLALKLSELIYVRVK